MLWVLASAMSLPVHQQFYMMQGASDLQHAVHQYVNNSAIHVEGHTLASASQLEQQPDTTESQEASVVLRREEVVISAVELMPVRRPLPAKGYRYAWRAVCSLGEAAQESQLRLISCQLLHCQAVGSCLRISPSAAV